MTYDDDEEDDECVKEDNYCDHVITYNTLNGDDK